MRQEGMSKMILPFGVWDSGRKSEGNQLVLGEEDRRLDWSFNQFPTCGAQAGCPSQVPCFITLKPSLEQSPKCYLGAQKTPTRGLGASPLVHLTSSQLSLPAATPLLHLSQQRPHAAHNTCKLSSANHPTADRSCHITLGQLLLLCRALHWKLTLPSRVCLDNCSLPPSLPS